jgi:hypothetical protein
VAATLLIALGVGAGVLKIAGCLLALALVPPWGRVAPRRLLLGVIWTASAVLTAYGGLLTAAGTVVLTGLLQPSGPVHRTALQWRPGHLSERAATALASGPTWPDR